MVLYGDVLKSGTYIGFGGEFYTLWRVGTPETDNWGNVKQHATYVCNISKDLDEATKQYPDAIVSSLKGETWIPSSYSKEEVTYEPNEFRFGKYKGKKFEDIDDGGYLSWYLSENVGNLEVEERIEKLLIERFGFVKIKDGIESAEDNKIRTDIEKAVKDILSKPIILSSNFKDYGMREWEFRINADEYYELFPYGIKVRYEGALDDELDLVQRYYSGYEYWTPKGKRSSKGREVELEVEDVFIKPYNKFTLLTVTDVKLKEI